MTDIQVPPSSGSMALTVRDYVANSLSENTVLAYKCDIEHFFAWGGTVPSSPEMVASYLAAHAEVLAIATLSRRLVAIGRVHNLKNLPDPTKSELVRLTFKGVKRIFGKPQRRVAPLLTDDLIALLRITPQNLKGSRDRALLVLAFCAALRRSEVVAIKFEDLEFNARGIVLTIPRSKTDQTGTGRRVAIPRAKGDLCPVAIVDFWLKTSGIESEFIFRSVAKGGRINRSSLSDRSVANILKHYVGKLGWDPTRYSGHSCRSGLATSAAQKGASSWKIMAQTGHKSEAMLSRYVRDGQLFTDNAADLF